MEFDLPVGAAVDVKELEYVSALHQTVMPNIRLDGSIRSEDIVSFLSSRYGIFVSKEYVRSSILMGVGGGDSEDECIDLMEMVTIILIPTLIKAANEVKSKNVRVTSVKTDGEDQESENCKGSNTMNGTSSVCKDVETGVQVDDAPDDAFPDNDNNDKKKNNNKEANVKNNNTTNNIPPKGLLLYVLNMILHDVTGSIEPPRLDKSLLRYIFKAYGEVELAEDDKLLDEMIECAGGYGIKLNVQTFARALTHDVRLYYDISKETTATPRYTDVLDSASHNLNPNYNKINCCQLFYLGGCKSKYLLQNEKDVAIKHTAPTIDNVADTQGSNLLSVFSWAGFILFYFLIRNYLTIPKVCGPITEENTADDFSCHVLEQIIDWISSVIEIGLMGLIFVSLSRIGNREINTNVILNVMGLLAVLLFGIPFAVDEIYVIHQGENTISGDQHLDKFLISMLTACVSVVAVCHFNQILNPFIKRRVLQGFGTNGDASTTSPGSGLLQYLFTPGGFVAEGRLKQAASYKVNSMINNALEITRNLEGKDCVIDTYFGQALLSFSKRGKKYIPCGGLLWTWRRLFNLDLFKKEGIWFTTRLLANNFTQLVITVFLLWSGINMIGQVETNWNKHEVSGKSIIVMDTVMDTLKYELTTGNNREIIYEAVANFSSIASDYVASQFFGQDFNCANVEDIMILPFFATPYNDSKSCSEGGGGGLQCAALFLEEYCYNNNTNLSNNATFDGTLLTLQAYGFPFEKVENMTRQILHNMAQSSVNSLYPTDLNMILVPVKVFAALSFTVALYLTLVYIPSTTSSILKLRTGVIPTFRSPDFAHMRVAPDTTTMLTGGLFWGCLYASITFGAVIASIVFLFMWQVTKLKMLYVLAALIGIIVTILLKVVIMVLCRRCFSKSLYRVHPGRANIFSLIMESINFALNVLFSFVRLFKLVLLSIVYVGRVDSRFLAPGVGKFGPLDLDAFPTIFLKDLIQHDAHRHPYIEIMGTIYLLNLLHGGKFCTRAGSSWRLLFVFALFPWLSNYRVMARPDMRDDDEVTAAELGVTDSSTGNAFLVTNTSAAGAIMSKGTSFKNLRKQFKPAQSLYYRDIPQAEEDWDAANNGGSQQSKRLLRGAPQNELGQEGRQQERSNQGQQSHAPQNAKNSTRRSIPNRPLSKALSKGKSLGSISCQMELLEKDQEIERLKRELEALKQAKP